MQYIQKLSDPYVKKHKEKSRRGGFVINLLFIALSLFIWYNIGKAVLTAGNKLEIMADVEREVEFLRLKNSALVIEDRVVKTDDYIEAEARNKLHYGRNGETQFVISDSLLNRTVLSSFNKESNVVYDVRNNVKLWFLFFINGV